MKTIGLIGGMSWESTVPYYRVINEAVRARLGGLHSAKIILYSVDFHDIEQLQRAGDWAEAGRVLATAARLLEAAGAQLLVLATNTMHQVADAIEAAVRIPLLHIADAAAADMRQQGLQTIGLLGTRFTMEQAFYTDRLRARHGFQVIVPDAASRAHIDRVIFEELCQGQILDSSRAGYRRVIQDLAAAGAEGVLLACTEIALLVRPQDSPVPLFDSASIHARQAAEQALLESP